MDAGTAFVENADTPLEAITERQPGAAAAFYHRYSPHVFRTLRLTMGPDPDLPDLVQEVFIRALDGIGQVRHRDRLQNWLTSIAIFTAREHIRRRKRRSWSSPRSPQASIEQQPPCLDARDALRDVYRVLGELPEEEQLVFVLRCVEGVPLSDAVRSVGVSRATFKRRLARAKQRFSAAIDTRPALSAWFEEGARRRLLLRS